MTQSNRPDSHSNRDIFMTAIAPALDLPFPLAEYQSRVRHIREAMQSASLDLLFLSAPESICYATGYSAEWYQTQSTSQWPPTSGVAIHVDHDTPIHFESEQEKLLVQSTSASTDIRIHPSDAVNAGEAWSWWTTGLIAAELKAAGWLRGRVGLEMGSCRPNRIVSEQFQERLEAAGARVVDATRVVRSVRRLKSPQELAYTRTAQRIANVGLDAVERTLRAGVTELEVYGEMIAAMARVGGEISGIPLPVTSGLRTGSSHALSSRKVVMPGDIVKVDICGVYYRYHANIARDFSIGEPEPEVADLVAKAAGVFDVVASLIKPGLRVADLLPQIEDYCRAEGIWEDRRYVGGYELGIAFPPDWVGEWIWGFDRDPGDDTLEPGLVANCESNFYLPDAWGSPTLIKTFAVTERAAAFLENGPAGLITVE